MCFAGVREKQRPGQDERSGSRAGGGGGLLPRSLPSPSLWRFPQAAQDGSVRHPPRLVPVLPHRLHPPAGRHHGKNRRILNVQNVVYKEKKLHVLLTSLRRVAVIHRPSITSVRLITGCIQRPATLSVPITPPTLQCFQRKGKKSRLAC